MISPSGVEFNLNDLLIYDPATGMLTWRARPREAFLSERAFSHWETRYAGKAAFTAIDGQGYRRGKIFGTVCQAHRVVWALCHGDWPSDQLDHVNGCRSDNRLANLRPVTNAENQRNAARRTDNSSGHTGVTWHRLRRKWQARVKVDGREKSLGYFSDKAEAIAARDAANIRYGFHENHGRAAAQV